MYTTAGQGSEDFIIFNLLLTCKDVFVVVLFLSTIDLSELLIQHFKTFYPPFFAKIIIENHYRPATHILSRIYYLYCHVKI